MTKDFKKIDALLTNLDTLREQQAALLQELRRSARLQAHWPEAFADCQTCTPYLDGTAYGPPRLGKHRFPCPYDTVRTVTQCGFRRADGVTRAMTVANFMHIFAGDE